MQRRKSGHVRHWHKPIDGNLRKFHRLIGTATAGAVETHPLRHDSSRWIGQVLQDEESTDPRRMALETVGLRPCDGVG